MGALEVMTMEATLDRPVEYYVCVACPFEGGEDAAIQHAQDSGHPMRVSIVEKRAGRDRRKPVARQA